MKKRGQGKNIKMVNRLYFLLDFVVNCKISEHFENNIRNLLNSGYPKTGLVQFLNGPDFKWLVS